MIRVTGLRPYDKDIPMKTLILVRHAKAMDRDKARNKGISEPERPLTEKGIKEFRRHCDRHWEMFTDVNLFVTSPFTRASETLDLLLEELQDALPDQSAKIETTSLIEPEENAELFLRWLKKRKEETVVAVSHEPFLSNFLQHVLQQPEMPYLKLKKGAIVVLRFASAREPGEPAVRLLQLCQPY